MEIMSRIPGDRSGIGQLCLRVALGVVMFPHGAQKAFAWFNGPGWEKTLEAFAAMGFPAGLTVLLIFLESAGALFLLAGFLTRIWALGFLVSISVCMALNHVQNGFFMNWYGRQQGEGFEYHLLVIGICLALIAGGGGRYSLDRLWCCRKEPEVMRLHRAGSLTAASMSRLAADRGRRLLFFRAVPRPLAPFAARHFPPRQL